MNKQGEDLTGKSKVVEFVSTPLIGLSSGFHFKAGSSKQIVFDSACLDSFVWPPLGVTVTETAPSITVNLNNVPLSLKDVGNLVSMNVSRDMATSSTGPDLLPPQRPPSGLQVGLVCNESSLVSSSVNKITFGTETEA